MSGDLGIGYDACDCFATIRPATPFSLRYEHECSSNTPVRLKTATRSMYWIYPRHVVGNAMLEPIHSRESPPERLGVIRLAGLDRTRENATIKPCGVVMTCTNGLGRFALEHV